MEEALRALLMQSAALIPLVRSRVDWGIRSQGATLDAITLHAIGGATLMNMTGPSGWDRDRVQIDFWSRTALGARNGGRIVGGPHGILTGYRGDTRGMRLRTFIVSRRSDEDEDPEGPVFRVSLDAMVWHTPLPTE